MIRQAQSYFAGAASSAALIAAAVAAFVLLMFVSAFRDWPSLRAVDASAPSVRAAPEEVTRDSRATSPTQRGPQVPSTDTRAPATAAPPTGGSEVPTSPPAYSVPEPAPAPESPSEQPLPVPPTQQQPDPAPAPPPSPEPAPTTSGGGSALGQTVTSLGQSVGQVTQSLLGPQSLVGGTLNALGRALTGTGSGG